MPSPNYAKPETMTREQLLRWAEWNYNHWADPRTGSVDPNLNQSAWYILLWWAYKEDDKSSWAI